MHAQEREIQISIMLNHPNVICTHCIYMQDNYYYFVMERADCSLKAYLENKDNHVTFQQRKWIIYQIACGLKYTAELCVCHHDLKVRENDHLIG